MSHFSLCSCLDLNTLFQDLFSDSEVAKKLHFSKTKIGCFITFGISSYFRSFALQDIQRSPLFSLMFDESLNKIFQEEQMHLHIRYWNNALGIAYHIYFHLYFMFRTNANNLVEALETSLININMTSMTHLSIDGQNTNWAAFEKIHQTRQMKERACLVNLQSCGFHTL